MHAVFIEKSQICSNKLNMWPIKMHLKHKQTGTKVTDFSLKLTHVWLLNDFIYYAKISLFFQMLYILHSEAKSLGLPNHFWHPLVQCSMPSSTWVPSAAWHTAPQSNMIKAVSSPYLDFVVMFVQGELVQEEYSISVTIHWHPVDRTHPYSCVS